MYGILYPRAFITQGNTWAMVALGLQSSWDDLRVLKHAQIHHPENILLVQASISSGININVMSSGLFKLFAIF